MDYILENDIELFKNNQKIGYEDMIQRLYSVCTTTDEVLDVLHRISTLINMRGDRLDLSREQLISMSKEFRQQNVDLWTKPVAQQFGQILKQYASQIDLCKKITEYTNYQVCGELFYYKDGNIPKHISLPEKVVSVKCALYHNILLTVEGNVYTWGHNKFSVLGHELDEEISIIARPRHVRMITNIKYIEIGPKSNMAISHQNYVYTWGYNIDGRLGIGRHYTECETPRMLDFTFSKAACGSSHSCFLDKYGRIYGTGDTLFSGLESEVSYVYFPEKIPSLQRLLFSQISIGNGYHTLALTITGEVYAWGRNRTGQVGVTVRENFNESIPLHIQIDEKIIAVETGWGHSVLLTEHGNVWRCGRNSRNQLADSDYDWTDGVLVKYVAKFKKMLNIPRVKRIICGFEHTMCFTVDNRIFGWGDNEYNCIGSSNTHHIMEPQYVELEDFVDLSVGKKSLYLLKP
jgi:alpha-tubulin suppressor-like RCC1 family protein